MEDCWFEFCQQWVEAVAAPLVFWIGAEALTGDGRAAATRARWSSQPRLGAALGMIQARAVIEFAVAIFDLAPDLAGYSEVRRDY